MNSYFADPQRLAHLRRLARGWLGTPFVPHARIQGAGVDCVNLCAALYLSAGFFTTFDPGQYAMDGGKHNLASQLTHWLDASGRFALLPPAAAPLPGDLLCFKLGRSAHHCGLVLDGPHFIHSLYGRRVAMATLADGTFAKMLHAVYRPVAQCAADLQSAVPREVRR